MSKKNHRSITSNYSMYLLYLITTKNSKALKPWLVKLYNTALNFYSTFLAVAVKMENRFGGLKKDSLTNVLMTGDSDSVGMLFAVGRIDPTQTPLGPNETIPITKTELYLKKDC
jgi:hypothetical protein